MLTEPTVLPTLRVEVLEVTGDNCYTVCRNAFQQGDAPGHRAMRVDAQA